MALRGVRISPVSDDGRGLKHVGERPGGGGLRISPVSDDGRGLKQADAVRRLAVAHISPVSDDGRGLKPHAPTVRRPSAGEFRPSAMTGVD